MGWLVSPLQIGRMHHYADRSAFQIAEQHLRRSHLSDVEIGGLSFSTFVKVTVRGVNPCMLWTGQACSRGYKVTPPPHSSHNFCQFVCV